MLFHYRYASCSCLILCLEASIPSSLVNVSSAIKSTTIMCSHRRDTFQFQVRHFCAGHITHRSNLRGFHVSGSHSPTLKNRPWRQRLAQSIWALLPVNERAILSNWQASCNADTSSGAYGRMAHTASSRSKSKSRNILACGWWIDTITARKL